MVAIVAAAAGLGASSQLAIGAASPMTQRPAAMSGVVVDAISKAPIGGARVYLRGDRQARGQVTDARGRFVFDNLNGGTYLLAASKEGYQSTQYLRAGSGAGEGRFPGLVLLDGQWLRGLEFRLQPAAAIAGTVRDADGRALVGADVRLLAIMMISGRRQIVGGETVRTDDQGQYRFGSLQAGTYYVVVPNPQSTFPTSTTMAQLHGVSPDAAAVAVARGQPLRFDEPTTDRGNNVALVLRRAPLAPSAPDGGLRVYPSTFFPSAQTTLDAQAVTIAAGEQRHGVDVELHPASTYLVRGTVEPMTAAAGRTLRLVQSETDDWGNGSEAATALVGAAGEFAFEGVPPGSYVIDARARFAEYNLSAGLTTPRPPGQIAGAAAGGFRISTGRDGTWLSFGGGGDVLSWGRVAVRVSDADVVGVKVRMQSTFTVSGRYIWDDSSTKETNFPRALIVEPARGNLALGVLLATSPSTAPDTFNIQGLLPGEYVFAMSSVVTSGSTRLKSVVCANVDYTYRAFDPSILGDLAQCVVTLTDKSTLVTGSVIRAANLMSVPLSVVAFPVERDQWPRLGLTPARLKRVPVLNDGSFRLQTLPAGEYFLAAVKDTGDWAWDDPAVLEVLSARASRVLIDWGKSISRTLDVISDR